MKSVFEFLWERDTDGYRVELLKPKDGDTLLTRREGYYLFSKGGPVEKYRPLDEYPALFREFADTPMTAEGVLAFANRYGFFDSPPKNGESLTYWYSVIKSMSQAIKLWESKDEEKLTMAFNDSELGRNSVKLGKTSSTGPLALYLKPNTLLSVMWLQFAEVVTSNVGVRKCSWCTTWFRYGTGTSRRRTSQYCSDNCRKFAHKHRKKA